MTKRINTKQFLQNPQQDFDVVAISTNNPGNMIVYNVRLPLNVYNLAKKAGSAHIRNILTKALEDYPNADPP